MKQKKSAACFVSLIILMAPIWMQAQVHLQRQLISTSGGSASHGTVHIQHSVGETIIETLSTNYLTITQGFQQPDLRLGGQVLQVEKDYLKSLLRVYPNPTAGSITAKLPEMNQIASLEVVNSKGQVLMTEMIQRGVRSIYLDLGYLPNGLYVIRLLDNNGAQIGLTKCSLIK